MPGHWCFCHALKISKKLITDCTFFSFPNTEKHRHNPQWIVYFFLQMIFMGRCTISMAKEERRIGYWWGGMTLNMAFGISPLSTEVSHRLGNKSSFEQQNRNKIVQSLRRSNIPTHKSIPLFNIYIWPSHLFQFVFCTNFFKFFFV